MISLLVLSWIITDKLEIGGSGEQSGTGISPAVRMAVENWETLEIGLLSVVALLVVAQSQASIAPTDDFRKQLSLQSWLEALNATHLILASMAVAVAGLVVVGLWIDVDEGSPIRHAETGSVAACTGLAWVCLYLVSTSIVHRDSELERLASTALRRRQLDGFRRLSSLKVDSRRRYVWGMGILLAAPAAALAVVSFLEGAREGWRAVTVMLFLIILVWLWAVCFRPMLAGSLIQVVTRYTSRGKSLWVGPALLHLFLLLNLITVAAIMAAKSASVSTGLVWVAVCCEALLVAVWLLGPRYLSKSQREAALLGIFGPSRGVVRQASGELKRRIERAADREVEGVESEPEAQTTTT